MGSIYSRKDSSYYWCQYKFRGRWVNIPTKETNKKKAQDFLRRKEMEAELGIPSHVYMKTTFGDLKKSVIRHYEERENRTIAKTKRNLKRLEDEFGDMKVMDIDKNLIADYKRKRRKSGLAKASVNRELATLRLGLRLLEEEDKIPKAPKVQLYSEKGNARQRYLTLEEIERFLESLQKIAPYLIGPVQLGVATGWRKSSVLNIEWTHVDRNNGVITLPYLLTKNKEPVSYEYGEDPIIKDMIDEKWKKRVEDGNFLPYVFLNHAGTGPIKDSRYAWNAAIKDADIGDGLGYGAGYDAGTKWHDLRRSAIIVAEEAGVPRSVMMNISGTKTETMYSRYNIVDTRRRKKAIKKRHEFIKKIHGRSRTFAVSEIDQTEAEAEAFRKSLRSSMRVVETT